MSTVVFSKLEFEQALTAALSNPQALREVGVVQGEIRYQVHVNGRVFIQVNSSMGSNGRAAESGENSIRAWLTDNEGTPIAKKTQRWVTRVPGWERRMGEMISKLMTLAKVIPGCPNCGKAMKIRTNQKGEEFWGCVGFPSCRGSRNIPGGVFNVEEAEPVVETPRCPQCNSEMKQRTRKSDGSPFWGCSRFPVCKGTRNIEGDTPKGVQLTLTYPKEQEPRNQWGFTKEESEENKLLRDAVRLDEFKQRKEREMIVAAKQQPVQRRKFVPSKYQEAIFEWVKTSQPGENLVVEAVAGSGKTTTGVKMLELVPTNLRTQFVAYNKHIKKELAKRAPKHVKVTTYHGMGFQACTAALKITFDDVNDDKVKMLFGQVLDWEKQGHLFSQVSKLVDLVRSNLTGTSQEEITALAEYHGIPLNGEEAIVVDTVATIVELCKTVTNIIDFSDMCWLPVVLNLPVQQQDFIFGDEAQDTDKCQIALLKKAAHAGTRIVMVGDRFQSLYGFRGADARAIQNLIDGLNAKTLPLSITYRCPKAVVRYVNNKFPQYGFEAADDAIEGSVRFIRSLAQEDMRDGDMVMCRTNAPLVKPCFALIRRGIKATIVGRDIGKGLIGLINKMKKRGAVTVADLHYHLSEYKDAEVEKLLLAKKNNQALTLSDQVETIIAISDSCTMIQEVIDRILSIFSDDAVGVKFSSVHKAKGLEADRTYILHPELMPHKMAVKDWELEQEVNIEIVASTRAKQELVIVEG